MDDTHLMKAINESGFPLQLGVTALARNSRRWNVALSEYPWQDPLSNDEKFIDVVLSNGPQRLVIECKRARDTEYFFLREPPQDEHARSGIMSVRARVASKSTKSGTPIDEWLNVQFVPGSPEASFCVIRKGNQRSQELLEKTAAEVVRATDALVSQESPLFNKVNRAPADATFKRVYVPVIVTTAKMYICDVDYGTVNLENGEVPNTSASPVSVVRFQKTLGYRNPERSSARSIEGFAEQSERSVVVVQAVHFPALLEKWDLSRAVDQIIREALFGA